MTEILCLSSADLTPLLPLSTALEAVKEAFVLHASGEGRLFPLVRERLAPDAMFGIKTGFIPGQGVLGLKAGGSWKGNKKTGDDSHQATVLLIDPATGKPRAFIDGNYITTIRTGAAGGVGAELFSAPDSKVVGVLGSCVQGKIQTEFALHVRPTIGEVRCFNPHGSVSTEFQNAFKGRVDVRVCSSAREAVTGADIVITATPSTEPLVFQRDLKEGAHINAVGSDTKGKRELDQAVLRDAEVFVDDLGQSRAIGELQGLDDVQGIPIGDVLRGAHPGRQRRGITVFDSTGISLQDLTAAWLAYRTAKERGVGVTLRW